MSILSSFRCLVRCHLFPALFGAGSAHWYILEDLPWCRESCISGNVPLKPFLIHHQQINTISNNTIPSEPDSRQEIQQLNPSDYEPAIANTRSGQGVRLPGSTPLSLSATSQDIASLSARLTLASWQNHSGNIEDFPLSTMDPHSRTPVTIRSNSSAEDKILSCTEPSTSSVRNYSKLTRVELMHPLLDVDEILLPPSGYARREYFTILPYPFPTAVVESASTTES